MTKASFHLATAAAALALSAPALAQADQDQVVTAEDLKAVSAQAARGLAVKIIRQGEGYTAAVLARGTPGEIEVHDTVADLVAAQDGTADILLGGTLTGERIVSPGERRGGTTTGGHVRKMAPGDLLWIPAGMPHQVKPTSAQPFRYLVVKVPDSPKGAPKTP